MEFDDDEELIKICSEKAVVLNDILNKKTLNYDEFFGFLMSTTNYERQIIAEEYKQKFSKTIFEEINAKISNKDTKNIVALMFYNYYELDARTIHKALKEGKRNEKPIIEIFASRPSWFLQIVNDEYKRIYGITLKEELAQEKKSDFITFLQCILVTPRLKTNFIKNEKQAGDVVQDIISKGLKKYGTDVELFKNLFVKNSRDDLIYICREFKVMDKKKRNLYDAVDDTVPKTTKELIKAIIYAVVLPSHYFAHLLKKSIVGLGTDEETLNRVLVERQEIDMDFIRSYYKLETKRELVDDIKGDTSGVYQQITVKIASV
jgi:annexin A7/11